MKDTRITTNILQVIKNKAERAKATYIQEADKGYWLYNGCKITDKHFDLMLPVTPVSYPVYL